MSENIKKRGRPKKTGDETLLHRIADERVMHADRSLASIIRVIVDTKRDTGAVRRLQRRFGEQESVLMEAAAVRHQQRQVREFLEGTARFAQGLREIRDGVVDRIEVWLRSPEGQRAQEWCNNVQRLLDSPEARKWAEIAKQVQDPKGFERMVAAYQSPARNH